MKKIMILLLLIGISLTTTAQEGEGTIFGYIFGQDSVTVKPFTDVWIDYNGHKLGVRSDINGRYKIAPIKPGVYNIHAKANLMGEAHMSGVRMSTESIERIDLYLSESIILGEIPVWPDRLIKLEHMNVIPLDLIKHSPNIQNPKRMLADMNSDISLNADNQMIIRGSRPGDVIYFVDGVKQNDMSSIPGVSIGSMAVYTGGIPAKYGDTTGGVVILDTKGYFDLYYAWKAKQ